MYSLIVDIMNAYVDIPHNLQEDCEAAMETFQKFYAPFQLTKTLYYSIDHPLGASCDRNIAVAFAQNVRKPEFVLFNKLFDHNGT
jgi:hypothetical protein